MFTLFKKKHKRKTNILITDGHVRNSSLCNCPELCSSVWYRNEITRAKYPSPLSTYPESIVGKGIEGNETFSAYAK